MRTTLVLALGALCLVACSKPNAAASSGDAQAAASNTAADAQTAGATTTAAADNAASDVSNAAGGENAPLKAEHRQGQDLSPGRNSFTESEARKHIEHAGYANVANLQKDSNGIWRAQATKNGQTVSVGLDFKGDVTAQ
jgi:putative membrane protein